MITTSTLYHKFELLLFVGGQNLKKKSSQICSKRIKEADLTGLIYFKTLIRKLQSTRRTLE